MLAQQIGFFDRICAMFQFLKKIASPFTKMGSHLGQRIRFLFSKKIDDAAYEEMERLFYESDLGAHLSMELVDKVRSLLKKNPDMPTEEVLEAIRNHLRSILGPAPQPISITARPHVIMIVGVNGSGKTTSLAKLAAHYRKNNLKVLISASDTFRAASVEQLEKWAKATGSELVKSQPHSDPSAVAFDALAGAKARGIDVVLIDTAGRLQTKTELMHELAKIRRICQKQIPDAPHETLLVLDATVGQNAIDQAAAFHGFTPLTGIILTKLDGSAKGGIIVAIQHQLHIPIRWVGVGESADDLQPFDPRAFVDALL
ncbi:MAG: Signal recognition particle receptor FtsY [Parachlamydiales bacterium]|nr:Signal recognition particle receptor FtsY [Parachlamydiales bacterium]